MVVDRARQMVLRKPDIRISSYGLFRFKLSKNATDFRFKNPQLRQVQLNRDFRALFAANTHVSLSFALHQGGFAAFANTTAQPQTAMARAA